MMLRMGHADGMVGGIGSSFPEMLRPLFSVLKTKHDNSRVAGVHLVLHKNELHFFADTTAIIDPTAEELAELACSTADLALRFDVEPRIGFLSFSTFGSVDHVEAKKVRRACALVRERRPELNVEGEMQADAALMPEFLEEHYPFARLGGKANVLIFPNLASGNIGYKIAQLFGAGLVMGPFLVGLEKPISLLTRYVKANEVFQSAVVAAMLAGRKPFQQSLELPTIGKAQDVRGSGKSLASLDH